MEYINLNNLSIASVSHNKNIKKKTIIKSGQIPNITNFSQAIFTSGQVAHIHHHSDMWEVFFVQQGRGIMTVNNQEFFLEKGVCVVVQPHENHEIVNNSQEDLILLYFGVLENSVSF